MIFFFPLFSDKRIPMVVSVHVCILSMTTTCLAQGRELYPMHLPQPVFEIRDFFVCCTVALGAVGG